MYYVKVDRLEEDHSHDNKFIFVHLENFFVERFLLRIPHFSSENIYYATLWQEDSPMRIFTNKHFQAPWKDGNWPIPKEYNTYCLRCVLVFVVHRLCKCIVKGRGKQNSIQLYSQRAHTSLYLTSIHWKWKISRR